MYDVAGHEITRNKLRAADAWMDEYATIVHQQSVQLPASNPVGDLSQLKEVRNRLQCASFEWSVVELQGCFGAASAFCTSKARW